MELLLASSPGPASQSEERAWYWYILSAHAPEFQKSPDIFRSLLLHFTSQIMAEVSRADFEATMLYALQCIGCSHLKPKPEQLAMYMKAVMFSCGDIVLSSFTIRFQPQVQSSVLTA